MYFFVTFQGELCGKLLAAFPTGPRSVFLMKLLVSVPVHLGGESLATNPTRPSRSDFKMNSFVAVPVSLGAEPSLALD